MVTGRTKDSLDATVGRVEAAGGEGLAVVADATDEADAERVVRETTPDWIFHLAGFANTGGSFRDPERAWAENLTTTRTFYDAIGDGAPIDAAVADARLAISIGLHGSVEWGTPVLHMRAPDGVLFRFDRRAAPAPPPVAADEPAAAQPGAAPQPRRRRARTAGVTVICLLAGVLFGTSASLARERTPASGSSDLVGLITTRDQQVRELAERRAGRDDAAARPPLRVRSRRAAPNSGDTCRTSSSYLWRLPPSPGCGLSAGRSRPIARTRRS